MALDSNGNAYTVGRFQETPDFDPGPGVYILTAAGSDDVYVSKLDSAGDFVWAGRLGGSYYDSVTAEGNPVAVDGDGNLVVVGLSRGRRTSIRDPGTTI